jgi:hypothetical protein
MSEGNCLTLRFWLKELVKFYIWIVVAHVVETLTLNKIDQKYFESLKIWWWRCGRS